MTAIYEACDAEEVETDDSIRALQRAIHVEATEKGWWDDPAGVDKTLICLALIHSEVSEGLEAIREDLPDVGINAEGEPVGLAFELADVVMRTLDLAEARGIDLVEAIKKKRAYNRTRPHRHGGKLR